MHWPLTQGLDSSHSLTSFSYNRKRKIDREESKFNDEGCEIINTVAGIIGRMISFWTIATVRSYLVDASAVMARWILLTLVVVLKDTTTI